MDGFEFIVFLVSGFATAHFLWKWYGAIFASWPPERGQFKKSVLGFLPFVALGIFVFTLLRLAASDVVNDPFFILFYVALGFAWLYLGVVVMSAFFDLFWRDDVLGLNNRAALFAFTGGFLGLAVIYAGSNVGDGPGWWCVVFTGGLALVVWVVLGLAEDGKYQQTTGGLRQPLERFPAGHAVGFLPHESRNPQRHRAHGKNAGRLGAYPASLRDARAGD